MDFTLILSFVAASAALVAGLFVLWREKRTIVSVSFAGGMFLLALEQVLAAAAATALAMEQMLAWERYRLVALSFLPAPWLVFTACYARGNFRDVLERAKAVIRIAAVVPPLIALAAFPVLVTGALPIEGAEGWLLHLGKPGLFLNILWLAACVLFFTNLERTLRASTGMMRWRIKFMIVGLFVLFGVRIYTASQSVLYSAMHLSLEGLNAAGLLVGTVLLARTLARSRLFEVDLYLSTRLIYRSLAFLFVGIYLLVVGVLAQLVTFLGGPGALPIKAFLVFVGLALLAVLMLSDRTRLAYRQFVSRNFRRPRYEYRQVWLDFARRTESAVDTGELCRSVAHMVSDTFESLSATIWLIDEARGTLSFGGSTSLSHAQGVDLARQATLSAEAIRALCDQEEPVDLDRSSEPWLAELRQCNPEYFQKGGSRLCAVLHAGGTLLGMLTIGDRVSGLSYSFEELELFKTISDQTATRLLGLKLADRLLQAREMEAFQTMSAFFVHDLKNTANTLSLMLQNLPKHFEDPAFRADALRGMGKSVGKINDLIQRLTDLRQKLEIKPRDLDVNEWLRSVLQPYQDEAGTPLAQKLDGALPGRLDPDQLQKVVANLVLNAREAIGPGGRIEVATGTRAEWTVISVSDTGAGMSREFIDHALFRPFQSTKKNGMGIGLFHSRMIVEAHGGRMEVESEEAHGTTFRILIPTARSNP